MIITSGQIILDRGDRGNRVYVLGNTVLGVIVAVVRDDNLLEIQRVENTKVRLIDSGTKWIHRVEVR